MSKGRPLQTPAGQAFEHAIDHHVQTLLRRLSTDPSCAKTAALLGYELGTTAGWVEDMVGRARARKVVVLENERGYYLGTTDQQVAQWVSQFAMPSVLEQLNAMAAVVQTAMEQFNQTAAQLSAMEVTGKEPQDVRDQGSH